MLESGKTPWKLEIMADFEVGVTNCYDLRRNKFDLTIFFSIAHTFFSSITVNWIFQCYFKFITIQLSSL